MNEEGYKRYSEILAKYGNILETVLKCDKDEASFILFALVVGMEDCYSKMNLKDNKIDARVFNDTAHYYTYIVLLINRFEDIYDDDAWNIINKCNDFFASEYTILFE